MVKKTVIDSKLLDTIDDQIYKHLPIDKLTKIVEDKIDIAIAKLMKDNNETKNKNQKIKEKIKF
tara:strand:- start:264 stop:455 length:192 start_codon:yes stop_codon:yes gene_type:complete